MSMFVKPSRAFVALISIWAVSSTFGAAAAREDPVHAKYIFYFIGDGMGAPQRDASRAYLRAITSSSRVQLAMDMLPVQSRTTTSSADSSITDSAAAGTALSTGFKTKNGVVGMDPSKEISYPTIAEKAKALGKRVGIISTTCIDHATPATFYAHVPWRKQYSRVAETLSSTGFDLFAGGGMKGRVGKDGVDNLDRARGAGYSIARTRPELRSLTPGTKAYAISPRLADEGMMPYAIDLRVEDVALAEYVELGIRLLDNPNGFFMMVEGGKIDWACHNNDLGAMVQDTLAFDEAILVALQFARSRSDETLIVVTADHETGGLTRLESGGDPAVLFEQLVSADGFNEELRPYRERSAPFAQVLELIGRAFGLREVTIIQKRELSDAWASTLRSDPKEDERNVPITLACQRILARLAGYEYTSHGHTGVSVPTSVYGVAAERFSVDNDNTDLAKLIMESLAPQTASAAQ